jgi:hypothetical protein
MKLPFLKVPLIQSIADRYPGIGYWSENNGAK